MTDMKYSCEMEKKRHVTRQITGAARVLELKKMMKRRRRRTRTMTTEDYKSIIWTLVMSLWIFWTFQSDKISRKRIWMMYEDEEGVDESSTVD